MNHFPFRYLLASLGLVFLPNCSTPAKEATNLRDCIKALPAHSWHEETTEEFKKRIDNAILFTDATDQKQYISITGDGVFSQRLFILDQRQGTLKIIDRKELPNGEFPDTDAYTNVSIFDLSRGSFISE